MGIGKVTQQFPVCRTTMFDKCEGGRNVGGGWWRRNKAPRTRGGLSICPLHLSVMSAAVSTRNPAPCDLGMAVMKVKANGDMLWSSCPRPRWWHGWWAKAAASIRRIDVLSQAKGLQGRCRGRGCWLGAHGVSRPHCVAPDLMARERAEPLWMCRFAVCLSVVVSASQT